MAVTSSVEQSLNNSYSSSLSVTLPELSISSYSLTALGSNATDIIKSEIKDDCLSLSPTAVVSECSESGVTDISECVPDLPKGKFLSSIYFVLNNGLVFTDKLLPQPSKPQQKNIFIGK